MQAPQVLLLALTLAARTPAAQAAAAKENPVGQVITLLDSLAAKITKEGEAEEKAYGEFVEWCKDAATSKKFEIKTATTKKEELEAAIGKFTSDSSASALKIEELASSLASVEADMKAATTVREKEAKDFAASEAETQEVIETLSRAIAVIEHEMAKNPAAFAQVDPSNLHGLVNLLDTVIDAAALSGADKQRLTALVQAQQGAEADDEELDAPAAAVYKTHSSSIVEVLEDMKEKAEEMLSGLRKAETNAKHNYQLLQQSLTDQAKSDTKDLADAKAAKASAEEAKATAEGDLTETSKGLGDAKSALELASSNCMTTAADHKASAEARAEELKTISEATKILEASTAGAVAQTYSLLQMGSRTASGLRTRADLANAEVANLVRRLAQEHDSPALAQLASRIAVVMKYGAGAGQDPFMKVKGLISEMIEKLEAEAGSEATEKAYCDEQLLETQEKKGQLEFDMSKLSTKIDQASSKSVALKAEVEELQGELAALAKQQAEMDATRRESHSAFVEAKADLKAGIEGVRKALSVLKGYYGGAASASLLQGAGSLSAAMQQPAMPEGHTKASGAGSGIIGILEVVESDFTKNLAVEETEEDSAAAEYEKMTQANKVTKTLKDQGIAYKMQEYKALDKSIADLTADRETTDTELSAVLEYYSKLNARCIAKPETYEARKARREAEIDGLKEALSILEDEAALVQRGKGGLRGHVLGL